MKYGLFLAAAYVTLFLVAVGIVRLVLTIARQATP